jgi:hypothetical protein
MYTFNLCKVEYFKPIYLGILLTYYLGTWLIILGICVKTVLKMISFNCTQKQMILRN